jgi:signal transduction histidine kinase/CheY-like chemotaxis protein
MDILLRMFDSSGFPARWQCGEWSLELGWLHILSDVGIFGAYTAIPCVLAFFILRRKDIPFPRILWLFVAFIFACGSGHLVEAIIFWEPVYRLSGVVKFFTAIVSWATVIALVQIVPQALHLPGLARLNSDLRNEVEERRRVEQALRNSEDKLQELLESERAARGEAERANRIKDEFLSTVSHELRTPLTAIMGFTDLLIRRNAKGLEIESGLIVIERNAKVQAQIIEDLLDMSRIVSGKVRLDVKPVDIPQIVENALETVRPAAEAKGIRLQSKINPDVGPLMGDSGRLQQIVWNLLMNAVKFTPRDGQVQITLERTDSHLEVRVSDTGQGIPPSFLPNVFERFRQGEPITTRSHGGLGLGLSIVKQLVELHGGMVEAQSPGVHQGSTFIVRFPLHVAPAERDHATKSIASEVTPRGSLSIDLKGVRVLVVDDEPDTRELVRRLLGEYRAETYLAGSTDEALELFHKHRPDVLVSDIGMPHKDGYELMRSVRALSDEEGGNTPAAALSALARNEDRKHALLAGFHAHITKPVDAGELIAVVATLARRTGR